MTTQDPFAQAQSAINQLPSMVAPFVAAAQQVANQAGQQFGQGAVQGAQSQAVSNGALAAIGVGGVALLGLIGYAGYATGKKSPAAMASYGEFDMSLPELGRFMMHWHSGQWDPVYKVASFFVDDREYPDNDVVDQAKTSLERDLRKRLSAGPSVNDDDIELAGIVDALGAYLDDRHYQEGAFASFSYSTSDDPVTQVYRAQPDYQDPPRDWAALAPHEPVGIVKELYNLSCTEKAVLGLGAVGVVGALAWILWPSKAQAAPVTVAATPSEAQAAPVTVEQMRDAATAKEFYDAGSFATDPVGFVMNKVASYATGG
jgi:hypothetical protein